MNDSERMKRAFTVGDLAMQLVDKSHEFTDDDDIRMTALGLAYVTVCTTAGLSEEKMCVAMMHIYRQANRGLSMKETKQ